MDDVRLGYLSSIIICLGLTLSLAGHALDMEYVRPETRRELEAQFNSKNVLPIDRASVKNKPWTCDMYGMRTHLQVKRGVKLYEFKNADSWRNDGAQITTDYRLEKNALIASDSRFEDQVKLNAKGQLISQFAILSPTRQVVAYSVCKTL